MTHGVTENTAGLLGDGEAGGLNEATSDIFGTAVEWYANLASDNPDYLIGELVNLNGDGTPLRYLDRPSRDGRSADCWSSTLGGLDPHYSSGPLNHWFYLASEGSGAKVINGVSYNSLTCNGLPVTGYRSGPGRKDLVPRPVDIPHVEQHLRGRSRGGHPVRQGPVWRHIGRVRRHRGVVLCDRRAAGRLDLRRHPAAPSWQQPVAQLGLRVGCGQLDRHGRTYYEQHRPTGALRQLEDVARRQGQANHPEPVAVGGDSDQHHRDEAVARIPQRLAARHSTR